ncbi:hypothetical protein Sjap_023975 [Stephania japonica]|uniref:Uncharacterized protein n=1 Tax=Stephania japonica TaxID=461633 RepID=A0AAP0EHW6_9MAGN
MSSVEVWSLDMIVMYIYEVLGRVQTATTGQGARKPQYNVSGSYTTRGAVGRKPHNVTHGMQTREPQRFMSRRGGGVHGGMSHDIEDIVSYFPRRTNSNSGKSQDARKLKECVLGSDAARDADRDLATRCWTVFRTSEFGTEVSGGWRTTVAGVRYLSLSRGYHPLPHSSPPSSASHHLPQRGCNRGPSPEMSRLPKLHPLTSRPPFPPNLPSPPLPHSPRLRLADFRRGQWWPENHRRRSEIPLSLSIYLSDIIFSPTPLLLPWQATTSLNGAGTEDPLWRRLGYLSGGSVLGRGGSEVVLRRLYWPEVVTPYATVVVDL